MRRLLGVLRDNGDAEALQPQPGIAQLAQLAAAVSAAGLPVELHVDQGCAMLAPALQLNVYRIVQEALTNALKHAGRTRARVTIERNDESVTIEVTDDGTGNGAAVSGGHGLLGMRERVALFGGDLHAGPRPGRRLRRPGHPAARAMIRILLADDQELVREGLRMLLDAKPDLEVVGEAADGKQALAETRRLDPDEVLMDVRMPELDGIDATGRLVAAGARARILVLTTFDLDEYVYRALKAGASGFLLKDASREQLSGAVRTVAAGEALLAPAITRRLMKTSAAAPNRGRSPTGRRR